MNESEQANSYLKIKYCVVNHLFLYIALFDFKLTKESEILKDEQRKNNFKRVI